MLRPFTESFEYMSPVDYEVGTFNFKARLPAVRIRSRACLFPQTDSRTCFAMNNSRSILKWSRDKLNVSYLFTVFIVFLLIRIEFFLLFSVHLRKEIYDNRMSLVLMAFRDEENDL